MKTIATSTVERWANTLEKLSSQIPRTPQAWEATIHSYVIAVEELRAEIGQFAAGIRFWLEANTVPPVKRPKKKRGKKRRK